MTSMFPHSSTKLWDVQSKAQTLLLVSVASSASGVEKPGQGEGSVCKVLAVRAGRPEFDPQNLCKGQVRHCASVGMVGKQADPGGLLASQLTKSNKL